MKNILITGANSYIGNSLKEWLANYPNEYKVDAISVRGEQWKKEDFSKYDVVFHAAGIAHQKETDRNAGAYYLVNRDLAYNVAKKAKAEKVGQFIFLSSMSVYGMDTGIIDETTKPNPKSHYGKSKLEAEQLIQPLEGNGFEVAVIRPPMIYGKGCKGNYQSLSKLAKITPIFPKIENQRSMVFIDNLSEFIKVLIDNEEQGMFYPQNEEYVCTSDMVNDIAVEKGKNIILTNKLNKIIHRLNNRYLNKIFGDLKYLRSAHSNNNINVNFLEYKKTINLAEGKTKKVMILSNHHAYTYNFRKEIIQRLIDEEYKVYVVQPYGEKVNKLKEMGCECIDIPLDRRGKNPFADLKLVLMYFSVIKKINPGVIISYTIKPNLYGGLVSRFLNIPHIPNITGLGTALEYKSIMQKLLIIVNRSAFKKSKCIMFQNQDNKLFFENNKIGQGKYKLIPGSGINIQKFSILEYPAEKRIKFVFISRIMKEKGIDQYIEAAKFITSKYLNTEFHICGFCEGDYETLLKDLEKKKVIIYHGMIDNIQELLKEMHCTIHPTYYPEGISNVLLESAASGRPVITTRRSGCKEVVEPEISGFLVNEKDVKDLIAKIEKFINYPFEEKREMGRQGREKVVNEFNRDFIVNSYIEEVNKIEF